MVWLFPKILLFAFKMFFTTRKIIADHREQHVGHFDGANKLRFFWYSLTKHTEDICYYDDKAYVSVLVFIFSALTIS